MCLENKGLNYCASEESEKSMNQDRMKGLEKKIQQILIEKNQTKNSIHDDEKNVLQCQQEIQNYCSDENEVLDGILMLLKIYAQNRKGIQDERICAVLIHFLFPLFHQNYEEAKKRFLRLFNECDESQIEEIISVVCNGSGEDSLLCDIIVDFLMDDHIKGIYNKDKCALALMKWYFSSSSKKTDSDSMYEKFSFIKEQLRIQFVEYLLQEQRYQEILDFSNRVKMNNKFIYEALILSCNQTGNKQLEKQYILDYFLAFPKKETLEALLTILDEQDIELYHSMIIECAMKSKEVFKEACLRIGNADDLYFLLRKGNLSLAERIHVLSCHTIELYKKDSESTLSMLERDLMKMLHSANVSKPLLQDLIFALAKFKRGREFLNGLVNRISSEDQFMKELIQSVLEESRYVYSEKYETESWS